MNEHRLLQSALVLISAVSIVPSAAAESILTSQTLTDPVSNDRGATNLAAVDVAGTPSIDRLGSANNALRFVWIGPGNEITGIGWDVVLQTVAPGSWRDDMRVLFSNSVYDPFLSFFAVPGSDEGPGGPAAYSSGGVLSVPPSYPVVQARLDGLVRLEFFESFEDAPGLIDGLWLEGQLVIQTRFPIPAVVSPGGACLFGLSGLLVRRQRR